MFFLQKDSFFVANKAECGKQRFNHFESVQKTVSRKINNK